MKYPDAMKLKFMYDMFGTTISDKVIPDFKTIFLVDIFPAISIIRLQNTYSNKETFIDTLEQIMQKKRITPSDLPFGFWNK
jgi:hypothetical protein